MILCGDVLDMLKTLESETVQCCVTSPPYWGLRDYGVEGQIGLEKTPELYVAKMVEVFREVKRVLRKDGTLWLNLGDSYAGSGKGIGSDHGKAVFTDGEIVETDWMKAGLKPKDLVGIPWRVAFALQADGWYLRSDIIWAKPNPMPESVTDRPTKSHEYIFLLTKSAKYFYDAGAIMEQCLTPEDSRAGHKFGGKKNNTAYLSKSNKPGKKWEPIRKTLQNYGQAPHGKDVHRENGGKDIEYMVRNKRSVWNVATAPYAQAHFATFPEEIPAICIKAGTSEKGQCAKCGKPIERIKKTTTEESDRKARGKALTSPRHDGNPWNENDGRGFIPTITETLGWKPSCVCHAEIVPCIVLDPFCGSGTTLSVAKRLGRDSVGIDLNAEYIETLVKPRLADIDPLFSK